MLESEINILLKINNMYLEISHFCDLVGEGGKAVIIEKEKLSPEERKKYDDGWQNNAFNQYASDMISLHRTLDDVRDAE